MDFPLCCSYPSYYSDVMDIFRAILRTNEISQRTLLLTEAVIDVNSANYSAWHFRRLCLFELNSDLIDELRWVATVALDSPKNYQLWHHRRALLERLNQPTNMDLCKVELDLTREILEIDGKNYHAWTHRQWSIKYFTNCLPITSTAVQASSVTPVTGRVNMHILTDELSYIDHLLSEDVRNNSAWNQRFFVRTLVAESPSSTSSSSSSTIPSSNSPPLASPSFTHGMSAAVIGDEIAYVGTKLSLAPHNESPWNYLEGLMKQGEFQHHRQLLDMLSVLDEFPTDDEMKDVEPTSATADSAIDGLTRRATRFPNRFGQSLLVELWDAQPSTRPLAQAAAEWLAAELDPIRSKYWQWRAEQFAKQIKAE